MRRVAVAVFVYRPRKMFVSHLVKMLLEKPPSVSNPRKHNVPEIVRQFPFLATTEVLNALRLLIHLRVGRNPVVRRFSSHMVAPFHGGRPPRCPSSFYLREAPPCGAIKTRPLTRSRWCFMRLTGVEPARAYRSQGPEPCASANSATAAFRAVSALPNRPSPGIIKHWTTKSRYYH